MSAPMQCIFPLTNQEYFQFENGFKFIDQHLLQNNKVLFSGKFQCLVTSLLQQAAVSYSAEGKHVVYIRPESLSSLPAPVHGMYQMNYATVQNIKYLYISTSKELIAYLCSINNAMLMVPKAIIIERFDEYVSQLQFGSEISIAKMCSLLLNTLNYLHQRLEETVPVLLSVVDTLSPHLSIYSHYCQVFSLQQSHSTENGAETHFVLYELSNEEPTYLTCCLSLTQDPDNIKLTKLELVNRSTPIL